MKKLIYILSLFAAILLFDSCTKKCDKPNSEVDPFTVQEDLSRGQSTGSGGNGGGIIDPDKDDDDMDDDDQIVDPDEDDDDMDDDDNSIDDRAGDKQEEGA